MRTLGQDIELAKRRLIEKDGRAVDGIADALQDAAHREEVVRHAAVACLAQGDQLVSNPEAEGPREAPTHHDPLRVGRVEPPSIGDALRDLADLGIDTHIHPAHRRAG